MNGIEAKMNNEKPIIIQATNIHKKFKVFFDKGTSLKEKVISRKRSRYEERWVLRGVDLTAYQGEAVGLIGENGCGKSTMLKMLTRIMYPDKGEITIKGRVSSLIELGAGFHPDLSGRENIYTNAAIFGLTKKEIEERIEDIIAFSELGEYLDNPVRTYSSGMYMRLAFSIAINVDADVLLIDEILAVGDANFQTKCFQRLRDIKAGGVTIVIVSHDLGTIQSFCDRAIWLCEGDVASSGNSKTVVEDYRQYMNEKYVAALREQERATAQIESAQKSDAEIQKEDQEIDGDAQNEEKSSVANAEDMASEVHNIDYESNHFGLRYIEITDVIFKKPDGQVIQTLIEHEPTDIDIYYQVHKPLNEYNFGMGFFTLDNVCLYGVNTQYDGVPVRLTASKGYIRFHMDHMPLLAGRYYFQCAVVDINGVPMDYYRNYMEFDVASRRMAIGCFQVDHRWEVH